jgi:hypothetical protein
MGWTKQTEGDDYWQAQQPAPTNNLFDGAIFDLNIFDGEEDRGFVVQCAPDPNWTPTPPPQ